MREQHTGSPPPNLQGAPLVVHVGGPKAGLGQPIGDELVIGRGPDCDLRTDSWIASRRHAVIRRSGAEFVLENTSKNGTLLNGAPVGAPTVLQEKDVITLPGLRLLFNASEDTVTLERILDSAPADGREPSGFELDAANAAVRVGAKSVRLSPRELRAVQLMYERGGHIVSKEELASRVWADDGGEVTDTAIEQLIARLRRKIEPDPGRPCFIVTVRGFGYRFGRA